MKKTHKAIVYNPEYAPEESPRERYRWIENASDGLRVLGPIHNMRERIGRVDHTGWWLDPCGDGETVHGVVLQLPGQAGQARFVPAIADPYNDDCYCADFHDVYEAPGDDTDGALRDCARAADGMAERYAERERDYQTRETARMNIEEARETIKRERAQAHKLATEMRAAAFDLPSWTARDAICKALRERMQEYRATVRRAIREIRTLTDNPYSWLEGSR